MKLKVFAAILAFLALLAITGAVYASYGNDVVEVKILRSEALERRAELRTYFLIRTTDQTYASSVNSQDVQFLINDKIVPNKEEPKQNDRTGFIFVLDRSWYHTRNINFQASKNIITAAISAMKPQDQCAFVLVDERVSTISFSDKSSANSVVSSFTQSADTNGNCLLYDGIAQALDMASITTDGITQKVIIVISDGEDQGSGIDYKNLNTKLSALAHIPISGVVHYHSQARISNERMNSLIAARASLIDLFTTNNGIYALVDAANNDANSQGENAGRRMAQFGNSILSVVLDISALAAGKEKDGLHRLELRYIGGERGVMDTSEVSFLASLIPAPEPKETPYVVPKLFEKGAENPNVRYVQRRLRELYYYQSEPSGIADEETQGALDDFYEKNGLNLHDGMTMEGYELLKNGKAIPASTATPEPVSTRDPNLKFIIGDEGKEVREAKALLTQYGFYDAIADTVDSSGSFGTFDEQMLLATDIFCRINGLELSDHGMSVKAWVLLNSKEAKPAPTSTPTVGPSVDPNIKFLYGDSGPMIRTLQDKLEELYYYVPEANAPYGTLDDSLLKAINQFCYHYGLSTVNGLSTEAWNLLMNGKPVPKETPVPENEFIELMPGDNNERVNNFQIRLKVLQYFQGDFTPGLYDEATQKAQDRLCELNGIALETGASVRLQKMVFSDSIKENPKPDFITKLKSDLLKQMDVFGWILPLWLIVLVCSVLLIGVLITIGMLLFPHGHGRGIKKERDTPIYTPPDLNGQGAVISAEPMTEDPSAGDKPILINGEPPTINNDDWQLALRIERNGISKDNSYTMTADQPLIIGRSAAANITLDANDLKISREHGYFVYRNNALYYRDTSRHGTLVNGTFLHQAEHMIQNGCVIEIGEYRLKVAMK